MLDQKNELKPDYIELLKLGRYFKKGGNIIIVGRNHEENLRLLKIARKEKLPYMEAKDYMGPDTLIIGKASKLVIGRAASLTVRYSDAPKGRQVDIVFRKGRSRETLRAKAISKRELEGLRL